MLIGLKGSKSMLTFFSFPSSVTMVPQYTTKPLGGTAKTKTRFYRVIQTSISLESFFCGTVFCVNFFIMGHAITKVLQAIT